MAFKAISHLVLFANFFQQLQALTLQDAADEALLRRAGHGGAAEDADSHSGMVDLQYLMDQHAASETELHARAAETWRKYSSSWPRMDAAIKGACCLAPTATYAITQGMEV
mmetsp:Transcript_1459/g.3690  ORF Transcript_1459/g.3690 Transcript_1459/m.3690 type:complete len:111 (-) Transcript_1459:304-636(-)